MTKGIIEGLSPEQIVAQPRFHVFFEGVYDLAVHFLIHSGFVPRRSLLIFHREDQIFEGREFGLNFGIILLGDEVDVTEVELTICSVSDHETHIWEVHQVLGEVAGGV